MPDATIHVDAPDSVPSTQNNTFTSAKEEISPSREHDLRTALEVRLRAAEDRITDLDRQLHIAREGLEQSILQDLVEEIEKQRRVIQNLTTELRGAERERESLREQFLESEEKVFELERQRTHQCCRGEFQHRASNVGDGVPQQGILVNGHPSSIEGKSIARVQATKKPKPKPLQLGRRPRFGLYLTT